MCLIPDRCADCCERPKAVALETRHLGQGDGSLWFAVVIGTGGSAGFCAHGDDAALLVPGTALALNSAWGMVPSMAKQVRLTLAKETLIKPRSSLQGGLNLIHETAARDDSASLPL